MHHYPNPTSDLHLSIITPLANRFMCESITFINEPNCESIDPILRAPFNITKELFAQQNEFHLEKFVSHVNEYLQSTPSNKETISNILGVFSIVRPKQQELLIKIENSISLTHTSMENNFEKIFDNKLPYILNLDTTQSPIIEFMKNDDFENLQEFVSSKADFDFTQTFKIEQKYNHSQYVNLLDICAYYGSVQCFKYLVLNNTPFSEYVCPFSICGGNYEIIHYLENNYKDQNFSDEICLRMSIAYHVHEITDWLILNYDAKITDCNVSIRSYNYSVFVSFIQDHKLSFAELRAPIMSGNLPVVRYLCEVTKVNIEKLLFPGILPLHAACSSGHLPVVQYLCEVAKVNKEGLTKGKCTPLHFACASGYLSIVQYLCEIAKVNKEATDCVGRTPLHKACSEGHLPVVQYLCEVAKVNTQTKDEAGLTALSFACKEGHLPIVQYLCEVQKVNTEATDKDLSIPFHYACKEGHLSVVQYLYEVAKVDTEKSLFSGMLPLHSACSEGHLPVVQYLCEVAKVNIEATNDAGRTPLHTACSNGRLPVVQYLCEVAKVNTEAKDRWGDTPVYIACVNNHSPIVQYLCEVQKINIEEKDKGHTPLYYASFYENLKVAQYLKTKKNNGDMDHHASN